MNLEKIQEMWEKDSVIDPDNLHNESLKIAQLHSKYYTIHNTISMLKENCKEKYNKLKLERYNYYTGKADPETYVDDPFPYKIRDKESLQRYLDADEKLINTSLKLRYYDIMLKFLEDIIKTISNRTYQIKNAIEWHKFQSGFN